MIHGFVSCFDESGSPGHGCFFYQLRKRGRPCQNSEIRYRSFSKQWRAKIGLISLLLNKFS